MSKRKGLNKNNESEPENDALASGQEQTGSKDSSDATRKKEALEQDGSYIILPDVSDIPGQENITSAGIPGEMADTTISSDDEEGIRDGKDILAEEGEEEGLEIVMGTEADVTSEDLAILGPRDQDMDGGDDESVQKEGLDDTDEDGDPLNEAATNIDTTGDDLDIPETDLNDPKHDAVGGEDEENNYYSLGNDDNDETTEGTP